MENLINLTDINVVYLKLILNSGLAFLIVTLIKWIIKKILDRLHDEKIAYKIYSIVRIVGNIILVIALTVLWWDYVRHIITLISFLSAAFAIAIRDIILNWFCGVYIKIHRPFKVEDRIEINGIKGDVIEISLLGFDVLEVSNKDEFGQSTGVIVNFPNSSVFSGPIKNLSKSFKYVWNEIDVEVDLDSDINLAKKTLYKIVNEIDVIKSIPRKMKNQISEVNTSYRIYYNTYNPIIYTKIDGPRIVLSIRYLIHPKKARYIMSTISNKIYEANKKGEIVLYKGSE
ncbi:MAG TPA: hypothetical protein DCY94_01670 [Firmicutes bacterium]|nr:hypothetical protein [Bacillota bacterium]